MLPRLNANQNTDLAPFPPARAKTARNNMIAPVETPRIANNPSKVEVDADDAAHGETIVRDR